MISVSTRNKNDTYACIPISEHGQYSKTRFLGVLRKESPTILHEADMHVAAIFLVQMHEIQAMSCQIPFACHTCKDGGSRDVKSSLFWVVSKLLQQLRTRNTNKKYAAQVNILFYFCCCCCCYRDEYVVVNNNTLYGCGGRSLHVW